MQSTRAKLRQCFSRRCSEKPVMAHRAAVSSFRSRGACSLSVLVVVVVGVSLLAVGCLSALACSPAPHRRKLQILV